MSVRLYRTPDPVAAAISAAKTGPTLLRLVCYSPLPLRCRVARLPEDTTILRNSPLYDRQLAGWSGDGLIASWRADNEFAHDVQVMAEMPLSIAAYEAAISHTSKSAVIFRPPTWRGHHAAVEHFWPSVDRVRLLEDFIRDAGISRPQVAMLDALGLPTGNMGCVSDPALSSIDMPTKGFSHVRRALMRGNASRQWVPVIPIACRIAPADRTLLPLYNAIKALPKAGALHLVSGSLSKHAKNWRLQLRKLSACGSIEKRPRLWFYYTGFGRPDYERIDKENSEAKVALSEMISKVESAPVFNLKEKRRA